MGGFPLSLSPIWSIACWAKGPNELNVPQTSAERNNHWPGEIGTAGESRIFISRQVTDPRSHAFPLGVSARGKVRASVLDRIEEPLIPPHGLIEREKLQRQIQSRRDRDGHGQDDGGVLGYLAQVHP
jgi:hypothetical protein